MCMYAASFGPTFDSFSSASVDGPQNSLVQYTGVANSARIGRGAGSAPEIVSRWSSGSGTFAPSCARESTASGSFAASAIVRFSVWNALSPIAGRAGLSDTPKAALRVTGCPPASNDSWACQTPVVGKVTSSRPYTPRASDGEVSCGLDEDGVPGAAMYVAEPWRACPPSAGTRVSGI